MCEADSPYNTDSFIILNAGKITLSNSNKTLLSTAMNWKTSRGKVVMETGKWQFQFRIDKVPSDGTIATMIGVCTPSTTKIAYQGEGWMFYGYDGHKWHKYSDQQYNNVKWKTGDIIGMFLDMDKHTLRYEYNKKDCGIAYENLPSKLVLAIDMYYVNEQVTIL
ncbi:spry domain containing socs box protein [Anaeramoeba flamelloides]|uniref:Spry domain containing socs box protein n=1 Tax=Anaeramoeba flamelloides TaxID=1746091 RepID=A0AAV7Y2C9_9EUKA|nr:spry domain containing socs box protein [Anaeramoeba flamelloides]KAJ6227505.1 spry domain containing socs box protein [Anaeramoeba flamelloides]